MTAERVISHKLLTLGSRTSASLRIVLRLGPLRTASLKSTLVARGEADSDDAHGHEAPTGRGCICWRPAESLGFGAPNAAQITVTRKLNRSPINGKNGARVSEPREFPCNTNHVHDCLRIAKLRKCSASRRRIAIVWRTQRKLLASKPKVPRNAQRNSRKASEPSKTILSEREKRNKTGTGLVLPTFQ